MSPNSLAPLLLRVEHRPQALCRVLCFSPAGGSASAYAAGHRALPNSIEVCAVQLPGRESRHREPFIVDMQQLTETLLSGLRALHDRPVALFGHSLGGLVAFEYARGLIRQGRPAPMHLFVSASRAPTRPRGAPRRDLPRPAFLREMTARYDGIPKAILEEPDMLEYVLPILRADIALLESYRYQEGPPLPCPITAFGGELDKRVPDTELSLWRAHTEGAFDTRMFPGGHFFTTECRGQVLAEIERRLTDD